MAHETHFEDGSEITNYLATAYAEGFEESGYPKDTVRAWSYLCGTGLGFKLQGFFGRTITQLQEEGYMDVEGTVNWEMFNF